MKVLNIHQRIINQPVENVEALFATLATDTDKMWPSEHWPPIRFKQGLQKGASGGHGPIRYTVEEYIPAKMVQFRFTRPKGFHGIHCLEVAALEGEKSVIKHTIEMETVGTGTIIWLFAIRWLHDALLEDAFDKVENHFSHEKKVTPWSFWVRALRWGFTPRK